MPDFATYLHIKNDSTHDLHYAADHSGASVGYIAEDVGMPGLIKSGEEYVARVKDHASSSEGSTGRIAYKMHEEEPGGKTTTKLFIFGGSCPVSGDNFWLGPVDAFLSSDGESGHPFHAYFRVTNDTRENPDI